MLQGRRVFVVEDDYLMARELVRALQHTGADVLDPAASVPAALAMLQAGARPDVSILDVNLNGDLVFPVADALAVRRLPFLFLTAHDPARLPDRFAQVPLCEKPVHPPVVPGEVRRVLDPPWMVAIAAAGSLGAQQTRELLQALPQDLNAVVLLALHRLPGDPHFDGLLRQLPHPVEAARPGRRLEPGIVYVGSYTSHLMLAAHGTAQLFDDPGHRHAERNRNLLLRSLACWGGARIIGVSLPEACELIREEWTELRAAGGELHYPHARLSPEGIAHRIARRVSAVEPPPLAPGTTPPATSASTPSARRAAAS